MEKNFCKTTDCAVRAETAESAGHTSSCDDVDWVDGSEDLRLSKLVSSRLADSCLLRDLEVGIAELQPGREDNADPILAYTKNPRPETAASIPPPNETKPGPTVDSSCVLDGTVATDDVNLDAGVPGAYALAPSAAECGGVVSVEGLQPGSTNELTLNASDFSNSDIPIASLVPEGAGTIPSALDENDLAAQAALAKHRAHRFDKKTMVLGILMFFLVVGVSLVVVLVSRSMEKEGRGTFTLSIPNENPTFTPTSPPSVMIHGDLAQQLLQRFTNLDLNDPESPQSMAYQWLLEDFDLHEDLISFERIAQRFALVTLYYGSSGDQWIMNDKWLNHSVHECLWFAREGFVESLYDDHVYVEPVNPNPCEIPQEMWNETIALQVGSHHNLFTHLWLHTSQLQGTIPPEIFLGLPELRSISFYNNPDLTGPIPTEIGRLAKLEAINFGGTAVNGVLPTELGLLSNSLTSIAIINTNLEGAIPSELGLLHKLYDLLADQNSFTGTVPLELANATNLKWIYLSETHLADTFPVHLTSLPLEQLYLDNCYFGGTIPTEVGLMTGSQHLSLYINEFSGPIPTQVGLMKDLLLLYLDSNRLTGTLPSELGRLVNMTRLDVWSNQLTGKIPSELGAYTQATDLHFDTNFLTGTIPTEVASLPNLYWFETYVNLMSGSIPTEFGLAPLGALVLESNFYTGQIPTELGPELWFLTLQDNPYLTGTLPPHLNLQNSSFAESWHPPILNISGTAISGIIPDSACATEMLSFDCSSILCGCDCNCNRSTVTNATLHLPGIGNETL